MHIGARLKRIRMMNNLPQLYVCEGLVSASHYSNIENGRYTPSSDLLKSLAERMDVPADYLINSESKSNDLTDLLNKYEFLIDTDIDAADNLIKDNKRCLEFIPSIEQEVRFLLLNCYHLIIKNQIAESAEIFETLNYYIQSNTIKGFPEKSKYYYYHINALLNYYDQKYSKAIQFFKKAQIYTPANSYNEGKVYYNMAISQYYINDLRKAVYYIQKSNNIYRSLELWDKTAETYIVLGVLYTELLEYSLAEEILKKALKLASDYELTNLEAKILHNIGLLHFKLEDYNKALKYLLESLEKKKENKVNNLFLTYYTILYTRIKLKKLEGIEILLEEVQKLCEDTREKYQLIKAEADINKVHGKMKNYEKLMEKALAYFSSQELWHQVENHAKELSQYYLDLRKYKKAYQYLEMEMQALEYLYKERA